MWFFDRKTKNLKNLESSRLWGDKVKIKVGKLFLAAFVIWITGTVFAMLTCGWLFNWVYAIPPVIAKSFEAMFTPGNMVASYILGFLTSVIFVLVYAWLHKALPGKGVKKGIYYGLIVWLVGAFSGMVSMPFYMNIATALVIYWILQALVLNIIIGIIAAAIYKEGKKNKKII